MLRRPIEVTTLIGMWIVSGFATTRDNVGAKAIRGFALSLLTILGATLMRIDSA